jgi:hypothetical protein
VRVSITVVILGLAAGVTAVRAQSPAPATERYYSDSSVPSHFVAPFRALGDRLKKPGKERLALAGTLTDINGTSPVEIQMEKGGKLRVDVTGQPSRGLIVNGKDTSKPLGIDDAALVQGLLEDSSEALMESLANGRAYRFIGLRYRAENGKLCDLYDFAAPGRGSQLATVIKRYCFDSTTRLLSYVEYASGSPSSSPLIRTTFSDWRTVDGQAVAVRVVRTEGVRSIFTFQANTVAVRAKATDTTFTVTR